MGASQRKISLGLAALVLAGVGGWGWVQENGAKRSSEGTEQGASSTELPAHDAEDSQATGIVAPTASGASGGDKGPRPSPSLPLPDDYVHGSYAKNGSDDPWPRGCTPLKRGIPCSLNFHWSYRLTTFEKALVRVAAFENGSSQPTAHRDTPVTTGSGRWFEGLQYIPSSEATTVVFKVQLLRTDGSLLYEIDPPPTTLPVAE